MRPGTPGFVPERLIEAREARSIGTQVGLSNLVSKPQGSISRWENGEATPEFEALETLAQRLNVRRSHFMRPIPTHGANAFFFRARQNVERGIQAREGARIRWLQDISLVLQHYFDFPTFDVPDLTAGQHHSTFRDEDLERIAMDLRRHWRIGDGPITSMIGLLESHGFVIARDFTGSARLDGLCNWSEADRRPYILLARDKESFFRSQMDAAHEMGHSILHRNISQNEFEREFKMIEEQAFRLASAFLMPATTFPLETRFITLSGFIALKERWRVSAKAMIKRCTDLNIVTEGVASQLYKYYSARGWNRGEPLDDRFPEDQPRLLAKAVTTLVQEGTRTKADLLNNEFTIPADDLEQLIGLPAGWFQHQGEVVPFQLRSKPRRDVIGEVVTFPGKR
jgi:Zn-dependent peptidase ImmA (M78 family)